MFYTLSKGLLWYLLALILGFIIGYLLRNVMANRQLSRARAVGDSSDDAELERLRGRVANLEPVVAERDRLRAELENCRQNHGGADGARTAATAAAAGAAAKVADSKSDAKVADAKADKAAADAKAADAKAGKAAADAKADKAADAKGDKAADAKADKAAGAAKATGAAKASSAAKPQAFAGAPVTDVSGASEVLGKKIKADDLTVVEGIGPAISKLCNGIGIKTWAELATTEVSLLRTMLHDAGPRFQMHDPGTWPEQSALLAAGRWEDFKNLTDQLDGGRRI